jgi:hypothetical protein
LNAWVWGALIVGGVVVLASVYVAALLRGVENERVISSAISAMVAASKSTDTAPQRALLRSVTDTLLAQERAAARIEAAVWESALPGHPVPELEELVKEMLALPEPQLAVVDFLAEHGGGSGDSAVFDAFAADLVSSATRQVYADLADADGEAYLRRLLAIALSGRVDPVARAAFDLADPPGQAHMPQVEEADPAALAGVAEALEQATRRQLRLAALLHGQAEAILRLRGKGDERERRTALLRLHRLLAAPRLMLRRPQFQPGDLAVLEVAFDAVGEVVESAAEHLDDGQPSRAAYLLAAAEVPTTGGLPGRVYQQDTLSQVRPLAALGVRHRLEVCRWAVACHSALARGTGWPPGRSADGEMPAYQMPADQQDDA